MDLIQQVEQAIGPILSDQGYNLVRIKLDGLKRRTLQIMIERSDETGVTIEDCTRAHRAISVLLDLEDFIKTAYNLEVSSPGLDRPLVKQSDYVRFAGQDIQLKTFHPINGQKRFAGTLVSANQDEIELMIETQDAQMQKVTISFDQIAQAHLKPKF